MGVLFVHVDPIRMSGPDVKVAPFTGACGIVAWVNVFICADLRVLPRRVVNIIETNSFTVGEPVTIRGDVYNSSFFSTFTCCFLHCVQQKICEKKMT